MSSDNYTEYVCVIVNVAGKKGPEKVFNQQSEDLIL